MLLSASTAGAQYVSDAGFEQYLLSVVNNMRSKAGLSPLTADPRLKSAARVHLAEFAVHEGLFSHQYDGEPSLRERIAAANVPCTAGGEILLMLPDTMTEEAQRTDEALQTEESKSVLLNPQYSAVGFATAHSDFYIYAVGNLAASMQDMSIDKAEELAMKGLQEVLVQNRLPAFVIVANQRLRNLACEAANRDSLEKAPEGTERPHMFVFTSNDPEHAEMFAAIAKQQSSLVHQKKPQGASLPDIYLGACFARNKSDSCGTYWFVVESAK